MREVEAIPFSTYVVSSTIFTPPTTAFATVPNFLLTIPVPGNTIVQIHTVLDIETSNSVTVGALFVTPPRQVLATTPSQITGTTAQLVFGTTTCGVQRATIGQMWELNKPAPGSWTFDMRWRVLTTAGGGGARLDNHNTMRVSVI